MKTSVLVLLTAVCAVQGNTLLNLKGISSKPSCDLTCSKDQCCVQFMAPMASRKRFAVDPLLGVQYPLNLGGGYIKSCTAIKKHGERCLVRNDGQWCDCAQGLRCAASGPAGLDAYFGTCVAS